MRIYGAVLLAGAAALAATSHADEAFNTQYINSLNYNRDTLLAVSLAPTSQPAAPGKLKRSSAVVICTSENQVATSNPNENALLDPSGAVVKMDQDLARGTPTPFTLPRAPLRVAVDFPGCGAGCTALIQNPTNVSVPNAVTEIVRKYAASANPQVAARAFYQATKAYSKSQVGVELGFSAQWEKNSASASAAVDSMTEQTVVVKAFKQVYYTAVAEAPVTAGSVFASSVTLSPAVMSASGPPGFVSSVDYGRIIIVQMTINNAETRVNAQAAMEYATGGGATLSGSLKTNAERIVKNSEFRVLALGGNAGDTAELFRGGGEGVLHVIQKGLPFSANSPAFPISYKVQDLKTRQLASIKLTTSYVKTECQEYPNAYVDLRHTGGYVAFFELDWKERSDDGKSLVAKSWKSGNKTAPYSVRVWLPGDASELSIRGGEYTGLAWDKVRYPLDERPAAIENKCYEIYGTTLSPKHKNC
jgi:thiol-activated cytolysin